MLAHIGTRQAVRCRPLTQSSKAMRSFVVLRSAAKPDSPAASTRIQEQTDAGTLKAALDVDVEKLARQTAATFAPRASGATGKNPAFKGSLLYDVFEWQAWIAMAMGGLLSFNVIWPTEDPSIPRLLGMWSIWMFTIPSLRAKECLPKEKDALNLLFVLIPLLNVALPFVWKSFPFIFTADVATLFGVYLYKGVWQEVYGLPLALPGSSIDGAAAPGSDSAEQKQ